MEINNLKATNIKLTDDITEYLQKRADVFDKLIDPQDTSALLNVELEKVTNHHKHGDIFRAEINLHIAHGDLRAESSKESLFDAIDDVKKEIMRSLRRTKQRKHGAIRRGGAKIKDIVRGFGRG